MLPCVASDWQPQPAGFLPHLAAAAAGGSSSAAELLAFGQQVHQLWGLLCRQVRACALDRRACVRVTHACVCAQARRALTFTSHTRMPQVSPDVAQHPERHSLLPLPHPTFIPGACVAVPPVCV
jgi:DNA-binding helix-hairpin-helix protein with protein kinase domain